MASKQGYPMTEAQKIIFCSKRAIRLTINESDYGIDRKDIAILLACKELQGRFDWIDRLQVQRLLIKYGYPFTNNAPFYNRFNALTSKGFFTKLGGQAFYTSQKYLTTRLLDYVLRRLSTHYNELTSSDLEI